ncbi:uncharacterized protein FA14DRAFT_74650 [Meira miltonrushii]|uniref:Uncharacterized protein n=1 Tax=Meira miltonrushii TaxID=1280837 RepID=A0A316V7P6_9BASI|nr:uncharacterized protein FA14DRAFT_74650 [Meira miltonrushii]PWN32491.1 hypothetical protein FA14DRAFT_74650 [Meira miltonrushii]
MVLLHKTFLSLFSVYFLNLFLTDGAPVSYENSPGVGDLPPKAHTRKVQPDSKRIGAMVGNTVAEPEKPTHTSRIKGSGIGGKKVTLNSRPFIPTHSSNKRNQQIIDRIQSSFKARLF